MQCRRDEVQAGEGGAQASDLGGDLFALLGKTGGSLGGERRTSCDRPGRRPGLPDDSPHRPVEAPEPGDQVAQRRQDE